MKSIKLTMLAGAALSVLSVSAWADDLADLKAQIESLNDRIAKMEAAPQVPTGYSLLTISEGAQPEIPGMPLTSRERAAYGETATIISVLPTADAPATTTITWSGYARAGLIYNDYSEDLKVDYRVWDSEDQEYSDWARLGKTSSDDDDIDIQARGQLRVRASTDTAVGEVGVDIRLRANFDGNGDTDVYSDTAWGYWAMTPELTFGGGYADTIGNINYGYDGGCTCYYTDNADVNFDPGKTTQLRLSYESGPFSMGVALEDASILDRDQYDVAGNSGRGDINHDQLGAAAKIGYSGDVFSGEIAGNWRSTSSDEFPGVDNLWQVGAGVGFDFGEVVALSLAAAFGSGPGLSVASSGNIGGLVIPELGLDNQDWWGVSALASFKFTDAWNAEVGVGYKNRDYDSFSDNCIDDLCTLGAYTNGADYDTWAVLAGIYYDPVPQLTLGLEAEWYTTDTTLNVVEYETSDDEPIREFALDYSTDNFTVDFVALWRF